MANGNQKKIGENRGKWRQKLKKKYWEKIEKNGGRKLANSGKIKLNGACNKKKF